jgi:hypothetical protein
MIIRNQIFILQIHNSKLKKKNIMTYLRCILC